MNIDTAIGFGNLAVWLLIALGWVCALMGWWVVSFFIFVGAVCVAFFNIGLLTAKKCLKT